MIEFFKRILGFYSWVMVESRMAAFTTMQGSQGGVSQKFLFYSIYFNPKANRYKLEYEGENAESHVMYGEMLKRLASYNTGTNFEDEITNISQDDIVITSIPLTNEADEVFKFVRDDEDLIESINVFKQGLITGGVEIYKQNKNIIATDKGYFASFYKSDLDPSITKENNNKEEDDEE